MTVRPWGGETNVSSRRFDAIVLGAGAAGLFCAAENFISANPHFAKSALARFTPADFIARVEKYRIPYHEKTLGQLFCDRSAQDITGLLESECRDAGVKIFLNARVC